MRMPTTGGIARPQLELSIRRMAVSDLEHVMRVERLAFKNPWSAELFQRELSHDWSTILIAAPPGTGPGEPSIFGFLIYWVVHDEVHILNIATDPLHRRKSVARRLMMATLEQSRARGARLVTLEVRRSNLPATTLYRDLGFRAVGIRPNYYADEGEDAVVMNLEL
jgi:ribosomal-protein-alanine N-acetyltransferase